MRRREGFGGRGNKDGWRVRGVKNRESGRVKGDKVWGKVERLRNRKSNVEGLGRVKLRG